MLSCFLWVLLYRMNEFSLFMVNCRTWLLRSSVRLERRRWLLAIVWIWCSTRSASDCSTWITLSSRQVSRKRKRKIMCLQIRIGVHPWFHIVCTHWGEGGWIQGILHLYGVQTGGGVWKYAFFTYMLYGWAIVTNIFVHGCKTMGLQIEEYFCYFQFLMSMQFEES